MKRWRIAVVTITLMLLVAGCGGNSSEENAIAAGVAATQTKQAWEEGLEAARQTEEAQDPAEAEVAEVDIVHLQIPGEPTEKSNAYVTDFNSIDFANEGHTYSDQFLINRFERPFTVQMAEYRGYLDLILANLKINPPWIYADIYLAVELPESSSAMYSLEIDVDLDGRGDFWVRAAYPPGTEWTTDGVFVYEDSDDDVGGPSPVVADPPETSEGSNGYDLVLFQERQVRKRYVAIVDGRVEQPLGDINLPLITDWPNRPRQIVDHDKGKPSRTFYRVLQRDIEAQTTRLELEPETGRSHQLRVHLQSIGHAILGDPLYAGASAREKAERLMLHAVSLSFTHPVTMEPVRFLSETPF